MKAHYLPLVILLYLAPVVYSAPPGPIDNIASLIRQGNVNELSKLFAPNVEMSILDNENVYSKAQAAVVLDKFFSQHKPVDVKVLHKITSNPVYCMGVLILTTENGLFRIAYTLKQTDGNLAIIQFDIETERVK